MIERREYPRFKIPGARVVFYQEEGFKGSESLVDEGLMDDCSLNGIRFETEKELIPGARVRLELVIPGKNTMAIKGNIIWTSFLSDKNKSYAVVEFSPFGNGKGYNSENVRNDLENIAEEFYCVN